MRVRRLVLVVIVLAWACCVGLSAQGVPNRASTLSTLRKDYPAQVNQQQAGALLARFVWVHKADGFGLLKKTAGNRCPVPNGSTTVSCDWLIHQPTGTGCDALGDGPGLDNAGNPITGAAKVNWCRTWEPVDLTKFVAPVDPGVPTPPTPDPPPASNLEARVVALEAYVKTLQTAATDLRTYTEHLAESLAARLSAVENRHVECTPVEAPTSKEWFHVHQVPVIVCREILP